MTARNTAMVTGAGRGIGRATVDRLVADGLSVVAVDIDEQALETLVTAPAQVHRQVCDVTDSDRLVELIDWIENEIGPLSAQVNAAGLFDAAELVDVDAASWRRLMDVNALGVLMCMQAAARPCSNADMAR